MSNNRLENTRVVTFEEDYYVKGTKTPVYAKGSEHAIHHSLLDGLKKNGAKFKSKEFDSKKAIRAAQDKLKEVKKG